MSINSGAIRKAGPFSGNGSQTSFPFTFKVFQASDLYVVLANASGVETVQTLTSQYTVSLNANQDSNPGGSVVMITAPASGYTLTLGSQVPQTQSLVLTNTGGFYPTVLNDEFDKLTILIQQLNEQVSRSAKLPISSTADANTLSAAILQVANDQANIDAVASDLTNIDAVAGNATNINTVAGIAANVTTVAGIAANVTSVAGNATNINTVAGKTTEITTVAGISSAVTTVAGVSAAVSTNASNISAINTNASNITAIQNASTNATNAATSATNAAASATAAANSATAAAAAAASGLYRQVLDKSANYTVLASDGGTLFRMTTASGSLTVTLPQISTVTDGFKVAVVKWSGDANAVTVNRSGSDTINGATSVTIGSQYSCTTFVADFETNQWFASSSGLGTTNAVIDVFSGNFSTTAFTLSGDAGSRNNTDVFIGGVHQDHSTYTLSGTTLTFSAAPPTGTSNIEVKWVQPLAIGVPSDATVTAAKMAVGAAVGNLGYTPLNKAGDTITGGFNQTKAAVAASAIDLATANYFSKTISTTTTFTISNTPSTGVAASFILDLTNGGSSTVNWWSGVKWAGGTAPTLTASGRDTLGFFTHDGGTTWSGLVLGKDLK